MSRNTNFFSFVNIEKDRLYNTLVEAEFGEVCFPKDMTHQTVTQHIEVVSNTLWYLDGSKEKIMERSEHDPTVQPIPKRYIVCLNILKDLFKAVQIFIYLSD